MIRLTKVARILRIVAVAMTIIAAGLHIKESLETSKVVYATNTLAAYPLAYDKSAAEFSTTVQAQILSGKPVKMQGIVIQNTGQRAASDILVRIPISADDGFLGGWIARGDEPVTRNMQDQVTAYKFDKLIPGESVSFYVYLKNLDSNLADRIQVFDGSGHLAPHYLYVPVPAPTSPGQVLVQFVAKRWWFYLAGLLVVTLYLPQILKDGPRWLGRVKSLARSTVRHDEAE